MHLRILALVLAALVSAGSAATQLAASTGPVVVNGVQLSDADARALGAPAGRYWYDARSGLWGHEGGPAAGIASPGLQLGGPLRADASGGATRVFVNGRALHPSDLAWLESTLQVRVPAGHYWLDARGDFGQQGGPALVNLVQVAQARGGNAGGDNFWGHNRTSSYGNESGGAGYVCVDGTCATYGM